MYCKENTSTTPTPSLDARTAHYYLVICYYEFACVSGTLPILNIHIIHRFRNNKNDNGEANPARRSAAILTKSELFFFHSLNYIFM
jgi:hypothetical protein